MARIYLSPLIVDVRNKQKDTVFSKWKGINYIRSRVIPANPKSAAQVAVRDSLKQLVGCWQGAYPTVKLNWDVYVAGKDYSGFNKFIGMNVIDNRDDNLLLITREVGYTALLTFSMATGTASGEIDITFTVTPVPAATKLTVMLRRQDGDDWSKKVQYAAAITSPQTISGLTPAILYEGYAYFEKATSPTGDDVGKDLSDSATSQT